MATRKASLPPEDASELQAAVALLLERDEMRQQQVQEQSERRLQEERREDRDAFKRMQRSIEVIKWCIVSICAVWVISFIISIAVLVKVQSKVAEIQGQVDRIKYVIEHPLESAGAAVGGKADQKWREFLRLTDPEKK